jgi:hypothetical protein
MHVLQNLCAACSNAATLKQPLSQANSTEQPGLLNSRLLHSCCTNLVQRL